jgi:hypothetical protein
LSRARRCHGTTPSNSISSEKLRNVRTNTIRASVTALSIVASIVTVCSDVSDDEDLQPE